MLNSLFKTTVFFCNNSANSRYLYLVIDDYNNSVNNSFFSAFNNSILNKN